ncbi:hypothetical protein tb265_33350 [Gemmatimonadetes bacterium T265]|nr:hypothetical protein tb265_33350 [Gemmatimonadetes bacterium T265]
MTTRRKRIARRGAVLAVAIALGLAGCAGHTASRQAPQVDRNTITTNEIASANVATAYDLIRKLRPQFLVGRGQLTLDPSRAASTAPGSSSPRVYVDEQLYGDVTTLRGIVTGAIESVRFYSGSSAQQKYGHDNAAGVIAIVTKH